MNYSLFIIRLWHPRFLQCARFIDQAADGGSGHVVFLCNAGQRHSRVAIRDNLCPVDAERRSTDSSAFQLRSAHSCSNPFDDQTFLKLRNRTHNHDYRTAQRASRVNIFAQANELDVEVAQFVEYFQEMANASRHPIERRNEHDVEAMSPSICQQLIEARAFQFRT